MTETKTIDQPAQGIQPQQERRRGISRRGLLKGAGALVSATIGSAVAGPLVPKPAEAAIQDFQDSSKEKLPTQNYEVVVENGVFLDPKPGYSPWSLWNLMTGGQVLPESWKKAEPMQAGVPWNIPSDITGGDRPVIPSNVVVTGQESTILMDPNNQKVKEYAEKERKRIESIVKSSKEYTFPPYSSGDDYHILNFYAVRQPHGRIDWYAESVGKLGLPIGDMQKGNLVKGFGGPKEGPPYSSVEFILPYDLLSQNGTVVQPYGSRVFIAEKGELEVISLGPAARQKGTLEKMNRRKGQTNEEYIFNYDHDSSPLAEGPMVLHVGNGEALAVGRFPHSIHFETTDKGVIVASYGTGFLDFPVRVSEDLVMEYMNKPISGTVIRFGPNGEEYKTEYKRDPIKKLVANNLQVPALAQAQNGLEILDALRSSSRPNQNLVYVWGTSPNVGR